MLWTVRAYIKALLMIKISLNKKIKLYKITVLHDIVLHLSLSFFLIKGFLGVSAGAHKIIDIKLIINTI